MEFSTSYIDQSGELCFGRDYHYPAIKDRIYTVIKNADLLDAYLQLSDDEISAVIQRFAPISIYTHGKQYIITCPDVSYNDGHYLIVDGTSKRSALQKILKCMMQYPLDKNNQKHIFNAYTATWVPAVQKHGDVLDLIKGSHV